MVVGTVCGGVDLYDACVKKLRFKGAYDFTYVSESQVGTLPLPSLDNNRRAATVDSIDVVVMPSKAPVSPHLTSPLPPPPRLSFSLCRRSL